MPRDTLETIVLIVVILWLLRWLAYPVGRSIISFHRKERLMNTRIIQASGLAALIGISILATGCEREVSSSKTTTVEKDGTVKTEEEKVTTAPDGSITKEESSKKTTPPKAP